MRRPIDLGSFLFFLLLPALFLAQGFFGNRTPIPVDHLRAHLTPWSPGARVDPYNPSLNDIATQFAPWAKTVRMAWKEGSLPFWNRWNGCGMPLAANGQSQAFSPFTALMFSLPLGQAFVLLGATKLFLALSGTSLWLSQLGTSRHAARLGAVAFAFSFAMTPWIYHPATAGICLWPWILFLVELMQDTVVAPKAFLALVAVLFVWPLTGHMEGVLIGALFGSLWFGLRTLARDFDSRVLRRAALASLIALGLSEFSLLPQLDALEASNRLVLASDPAHLNYVPWVPYKPGWLGGFATSLFPTAFGDSIDSPMIPGTAGSIIEMGFGYFGVVGWACALMVLRPGSRRSLKEWTLLALMVFGLGAAMGLPGFRTIAEMIPGLRLAPPLRFLLFASAAGAPLAALELDRLLSDGFRRWRVSGFLVGATLSIAVLGVFVFFHLKERHAGTGGLHVQIVALLWMLAVLILAAAVATLLASGVIHARLFAALLTGLTAIELFHEGTRLYRFYSPAELYPETPLIRFLRSQSSPYRIVGDQRAVFPNTNVFAGVESIETHDPAERRDYVEFLDLTAGYPTFDYFKMIHNLNSPALDFLNVKYVVMPAGGHVPGPKWTMAYEGLDGKVFENTNVLPRLFAPPMIEFVAPAKATMSNGNALELFGMPLTNFLAAGAYRDTAMVLETGGFAAEAGRRQNGKVQIENFVETTNEIRFSVSVSGREALLVSSVTSDGGWSATDESGRRLPVGFVNGPFLAVSVPSGAHRIRLDYVPPGFRLGTVISILTLVGLIVGSLFMLRRRQHRGHPTNI